MKVSNSRTPFQVIQFKERGNAKVREREILGNWPNVGAVDSEPKQKQKDIEADDQP